MADVHRNWVNSQQRPSQVTSPTTSFDTLDSFTDALKALITARTQTDPNECTSFEFSLSALAVVPLVQPSFGPYAVGGEHDLPAHFKLSAHEETSLATTNGYPSFRLSAMLGLADRRELQSVQRAASRGIMQMIERVDGFRYSFNNAWESKSDQAFRFSYTCQESLQSRNGNANDPNRTPTSLHETVGRARKPTYDCRGSVSMKFNNIQRCVTVMYRHILVHSRVANPSPMQVEQMVTSATSHSSQVTPPTRGSNGSTIPTSDERPHPPPSQPVWLSQGSSTSHSLKRKRDPAPVQRANRSTKTLSLADLLKHSSGANAKKQPGSRENNQQSSSNTLAVTYEVPSWQQPMKHMPSAPVANMVSPSPYPPPYSPQLKPKVSATTDNQSKTTKSGSRESRTLHAPGLFTTMKPTKTSARRSKFSHAWALSSAEHLRQDSMVGSSQVPLPRSGGRPVQVPEASASSPSSSIPSFVDYAKSSSVAMTDSLPLNSWSTRPGVVRDESPDPWFPKRNG